MGVCGGVRVCGNALGIRYRLRRGYAASIYTLHKLRPQAINVLCFAGARFRLQCEGERGGEEERPSTIHLRPVSHRLKRIPDPHSVQSIQHGHEIHFFYFSLKATVIATD